MTEHQTRIVRSVCPYCKHENHRRLWIDSGQLQLVTCDVEAGGCDRQYAVKVWTSIWAQPYTIEGQGEWCRE